MAVVPFPPNINYPVEEMPIESSRTMFFDRNRDTRMTSNPWSAAVGIQTPESLQHDSFEDLNGNH